MTPLSLVFIKGLNGSVTFPKIHFCDIWPTENNVRHPFRFFVDLKKKVVSIKNVNNLFQPSGVFAGLFDLLCLKNEVFDDPGVRVHPKH